MLTVKTDSRERVRRKIKRSQKALGPQLIILSEMAQLHAHCVSKCGDDADKSIIIFEEKKKEKKKRRKPSAIVHYFSKRGSCLLKPLNIYAACRDSHTAVVNMAE